GDAELVAHPFEHRPGGEDATVERVLDPAVDAPGNRRQQAAGRLRDLVANVGEYEDPRAVGGLDAAGGDAGGTGEGGLLVGHLRPQRQLDRPALVLQRAQLSGTVTDLGKHLLWDAEDLAETIIEAGPIDALQLHPRPGRDVGGEAGAQPVAEK